MHRSQFQSLRKEKLVAIFQALFDDRDETFGNARLARNIFESTINNQATRIISYKHIDEKILSTIELTDLNGIDELRRTAAFSPSQLALQASRPA